MDQSKIKVLKMLQSLKRYDPRKNRNDEMVVSKQVRDQCFSKTS